ncbi:ImmA/IrrE family metallo-endopeptidase [Microbacterium sp.]|uniref:ImmA/IrrE family metallo-endopeptidase n=1 Tax=Microbacterium sp. TaxID=51671 RepID=UPI003F9BD10D
MSQWAGEHAVILINATLPTDRKRLTIAHELGHLVLHSQYVDLDVEEQANCFAGEFLMPPQVIEPQLTNLTLGKLSDLKTEWGVSMQAIFERAYRMGKATADERQKFYRQMNSRGWKTREPGSDLLAPERPELAISVGRQLDQSGLTRSEIQHLLGTRDEQASPFYAPRHGTLRAV